MRLIDADNYRSEFLDSSNREFNPMKMLDMQETVNAVVIPKGATNGDMVKSLFPDWKIEHIRKMSGMNRYECNINTINRISFYDDWWNTEYKQGDE